MRTLIASGLALALLASAAMAGEKAGPLAPGKPAGIKQAQEGNTTALVIITGIVIGGLAIGLATSSDGVPGGPVTLTTSPTTTIVP